MSLQVGTAFNLLNVQDKSVTWSSTNPDFTVDANGTVHAPSVDALRPNGQTVITATNPAGADSCKITVVDWTTNNYRLDYIGMESGSWVAMGRNGERYYTSGTGLYRNNNGSPIKLSDPLPYPANESFVDTPFGYFKRINDCSIYMSSDLVTWELIFTPINPSTNKSSLLHGWAWKYDEATDTGYIFIGEYSVNISGQRHKVYCITIGETITSDVLIDFYAPSEYAADNNNVPAATHVHVVAIDPFTGNLWIDVGDSTAYCGMYYSTDNGATINTFAVGSQDYRCLSIWFTANYIYWNVDSDVHQSVWRIRRDNIGNPALKERVKLLDNGSLWYHMLAKDPDGVDFVIMAGAAEGQIRDWNARIFGIWENQDGTNRVEELAVLPSSTPDAYSPMVQLEPMFQDAEGYLYFKSRNMTPNLAIWKMQLVKL